ncbi:hypothetical protein BD770DRAFT_404519 [Pilaira anomala]|nr:hypothetical protein BD770DRAFT_404519 [Pilaira anomala]
MILIYQVIRSFFFIQSVYKRQEINESLFRYKLTYFILLFSKLLKMAESSQGRYRLNRPPEQSIQNQYNLDYHLTTDGHIANVAAHHTRRKHSPNTQPASLSRQTSNMDISRQNSYMDISRQTSFMDTSVFEDDGAGYSDGDLGSFDDFDPFANDMNDNEESDGSDEPDRPSDNDSDDNESENVDGNPTYPFKNEYMMTALLYFKANSVKYSEDQIKSILDFTKNMCEIAVSEYQAQIRLDPSNTEYDFKGFPTPHCITKFHKAKTSRIPQFPSANYYVKDSNGVPYDRYQMSQGEKWTKEKLFEHPMLVITGSDNRFDNSGFLIECLSYLKTILLLISVHGIKLPSFIKNRMSKWLICTKSWNQR